MICQGADPGEDLHNLLPSKLKLAHVHAIKQGSHSLVEEALKDQDGTFQIVFAINGKDTVLRVADMEAGLHVELVLVRIVCRLSRLELFICIQKHSLMIKSWC